MAAVPAPAGWGWRPGSDLAEAEPGALPDLPLLRFLRPRTRMRVLREVAPRFPEGTTTQQVQAKYDLPYHTAFDLLHRANRTGTRRAITESA